MRKIKQIAKAVYQNIDTAAAKQDARRIGVALCITGIVAILIHQKYAMNGIVAIMIGILLIYAGLQRNGD